MVHNTAAKSCSTLNCESPEENPCAPKKEYKCYPVQETVCQNKVVPKCKTNCRPEPNCVPGSTRPKCTQKRHCAIQNVERCTTVVGRECPKIIQDPVESRDPSTSVQTILKEELLKSLKNVVLGRDDGCWDVPKERCISVPVNQCHFENVCKDVPVVCRPICREVCRAVAVNTCSPEKVQKCETILTSTCWLSF